MCRTAAMKSHVGRGGIKHTRVDYFRRDSRISQHVFSEDNCSLQLAGGAVRQSDGSNLLLWQIHYMECFKWHV